MKQLPLITYENTVSGLFVRRLNRFTAEVLIDGRLEKVHVKNTGRLKELLLPDAQVTLQKSDNPNRRTVYDLISVYKPGLEWVNIDSLAPNALMKLYLQKMGYDAVKPEYTYGKSRFDFFMERNGEKYLTEVKGCTLAADPEDSHVSDRNAEAGSNLTSDRNTEAGSNLTADRNTEAGSNLTPDRNAEAGSNLIPYRNTEAGSNDASVEKEKIGLFPDTPTERGVKHLNELAAAAKEGYHCTAAFVIQMNGIHKVFPNNGTQPEFGKALKGAIEAGVQVAFYPCHVEADSIRIIEEMIRLSV